MFRTSRSHRSVTSASPRRRLAGVVAVVALGASVLTGCAAGQISQTADQISGVDGAQGRVGEVTVHNALLATPDGPNYPKGSQAPLTLWISNDATVGDQLTAVTTDAGTVDLSGPVDVPAGSIIEVGGAGGPVTAAVSKLTRELDYGISVPMTFSFANAGDLTLNVPIEIPAERGGRSESTDIYPEEQPNLWQSGEQHPSNLTSPAPSSN